MCVCVCARARVRACVRACILYMYNKSVVSTPEHPYVPGVTLGTVGNTRTCVWVQLEHHRLDDLQRVALSACAHNPYCHCRYPYCHHRYPYCHYRFVPGLAASP